MRVEMRIRDLQWSGISAWPPQWWTTGQSNDEEGRLEAVYLSHDKMPFCISVDANHLGAEKRGIIILDDPADLYILYLKLKENIGKTLTEIGDLEIYFDPLVPRMGPKRVRPRTGSETTIKERGLGAKGGRKKAS
jgi:hypothetical protein